MRQKVVGDFQAHRLVKEPQYRLVKWPVFRLEARAKRPSPMNTLTARRMASGAPAAWKPASTSAEVGSVHF